MSDDEARRRRVVALGTAPHPQSLQAVLRAFSREPDIRVERGIARHRDVIITEAVDESDGASLVRHTGEDPKVHERVIAERSRYQRHRVSEEQRSRRQLAWLASALVLGSAAILALAPQTTNVYLGAALLLAVAGAFGVKAFRIKVKDFELDAGERPARPAERPWSQAGERPARRARRGR